MLSSHRDREATQINVTFPHQSMKRFLLKSCLWSARCLLSANKSISDLSVPRESLFFFFFCTRPSLCQYLQFAKCMFYFNVVVSFLFMDSKNFFLSDSWRKHFDTINFSSYLCLLAGACFICRHCFKQNERKVQTFRACSCFFTWPYASDEEWEDSDPLVFWQWSLWPKS